MKLIPMLIFKIFLISLRIEVGQGLSSIMFILLIWKDRLELFSWRKKRKGKNLKKLERNLLQAVMSNFKNN